MGGRVALTPLSTVVELRTTALVPEVAVAKSVSKLALRVLPKMPGQRHEEQRQGVVRGKRAQVQGRA